MSQSANLTNSSAGSPPAPPVWRRLFHATAGSSIPLVAVFLPGGWMIALLGALAAGGLLLDLVRVRLAWLNRLFLKWLAPLLKRQEDRQITGSTYMLIAALIAFIFFQEPVAIAAMFFLSLGDPSAALVGGRMPGPRVFGKSPGGTAAFIGVAMAVVAALVATDVVAYHWGFLLGAVIAGLVELAPTPLDDNLTIPLIAGAAIEIALGL